MSEHAIRWTFDDGSVRAEAVCNAEPDADCRLTAKDHHECQCEAWAEIQRRDDGTIWHRLTEGYAGWDEVAWHEVTPADYCNVCLFINESGCVEELLPDGPERFEFVLAETPFEPVWENDGCSWRPIGGAA